MSLYNKRLELLYELAKEKGKEVILSDSGNYYVYLYKEIEMREFTVSPNNVTKNKLHTIGDVKYYPKSTSKIIMLTKDNKLRFKGITVTTWKPLSINQFRMDSSNYCLAPLYFYNKKCEWLKYHKDLWSYFNFLKSFKSLKEVRTFLGYEFISNKKFLSLNLGVLISLHDREEKSNIIKILDRNKQKLLMDTINLSTQLGEEFKIPKSTYRLNKIHDNLVYKLNLQKIDGKSIIEYNWESEVFEKLYQCMLSYKVLNTERALFIEGQLQHHCVASYFNKLKRGDIFLSISYGEESYTAHVNNNRIVQIRGKYNKSIPNGLSDLLQAKKLIGKSSIFEPVLLEARDNGW